MKKLLFCDKALLTLHYRATTSQIRNTVSRYSSSESWRWKMFTLEDDLNLEVKQSIEKKWKSKVYGISCPAELSKKPTTAEYAKGSKYILSMFPYPSGRLHLGHVRVYTLGDVLARYHRLKGSKVIHPMGWDAFGLPAENAARDHGVDAEKWTRENIEFMKDQIIKMGCCFDWEREFATCDRSYYRWSQWLFMKLFEYGLAYRKKAYVYWDPVDKTVLAEEQVDSQMRSWRSGAKVEKKLLRQWFIRTGAFAKPLTTVLESGELKHGWRDIVALQKHWIGLIRGYFSDCKVAIDETLNPDIDPSDETLRLWFSDKSSLATGTFCILKNDHYTVDCDELVKKRFSNGMKLMKFSVINPITGARLPVFSGPSELLPKVPESSDCRINEYLNETEYPELSTNDNFFKEIETVCKSLPTQESVEKDSNFIYYPSSLKLRDWLVSRQRKWGTPIPALNCMKCAHSHLIPFEELSEDKLSDTAAGSKCSKCGSNMKLETDTLDTFFDSSWYFYRFLDYDNESKIFDPHKVKSHMPVDIYVGGKEHATLHLYYARFMSHFLNKMGLIDLKEPFVRLIPVGVVTGETFIDKNSGKYLAKDDVVTDGDKLTTVNGDVVTKKWEKMSKSKLNGLDPELIMSQYGIDTTRLMMMAEIVPQSTRKWPSENMYGFLKWQNRIWLTLRDFVDAKDFGEVLFVNDEEWKVSEDRLFDSRNFYLTGVTHNFEKTNQISVAISKLQGLTADIKKTPKEYLKESVQFERALGVLIICMYPIMPAFGAQMWQEFRVVADRSNADFDLYNEVWEQKWPETDLDYKLDLVCKVNGKEVVVVKVERHKLDCLDEAIAAEIAYEQPEVEKIVPRELGQILYFNLEPSYRATINIRKKKPEVINETNEEDSEVSKASTNITS